MRVDASGGKFTINKHWHGCLICFIFSLVFNYMMTCFLLDKLRGGLKYFYFHPSLGKMNPF